MTALSSALVTKRLPIGDRMLVVVNIPDTGAASAGTAWVSKDVLELSDVEAVLGYAVKGAAPEVITTFAGTVPVGANFVNNAQGTDVAAGTNLGDLGVEFSEANLAVDITVIGIP